jgi:peptide deformylase
MEVLTYPNPILQKKSLPIDNPTDLEIKQLITEMTKTMRAHNGVGLAAPQVGKNIQLFLTEIDDELLVFINPKIEKLSGKEVRAEEGCLSFPGKYLPIVRPNKVKVKFTDAGGRKQILKAEGLLARAIQHEFDHLQGILFIEKTEDLNMVA